MNGRAASPKMLSALAFYGLRVPEISQGTAFGMLRSLQHGVTPEQVAKTYSLTEWSRVGPTEPQMKLLRARLGDRLAERLAPHLKSPRAASMLLNAKLAPLKLYNQVLRAIDNAKSAADLDAAKRDLLLVKDVLPANFLKPLYEAGKQKRQEVGTDDIPE